MPRKDVSCNMFFYLYENDSGRDIWVAYASEENFLEAPEEIPYNKYSTDIYHFTGDENGDIAGFIYRRIVASNADNTLTLKKPVECDKGYIAGSENMSTFWPRNPVYKTTVGYNWYLNIPYTDVIPISSIASSDPDEIGFYNKSYLKFYDGENQIDLNYYFYYKKADDGWYVDFTDIHKSYDNPYNYAVRVMTAEEEALLNEKVGNKVNLELCIVLERDDGMRYFLNRPHEESKIVLVADRFGNCIDYSVDGEIIDSMGRRIVYSNNGIQVEDENGNLQYVVRYLTQEAEDPDNESFYYYNTYTFRVERFAQLGDTTTDDVTVYTMKKHGRPSPDGIWCTFYYTIDQIEYPTGAHRDYTYDIVKTLDPFTNSVTYQKFTFQRSKAVSSKLYANNGTDYEYSYEYIYTKPEEGKYLTNSKKVNRRFTTEKIRKAPDSADDIKTTYTYDYLNRIITAESYKGTTRIYPKYTYTYPTGSESAKENPSDIKTDLEPSVSKTDSYSYYYNNSIPNYISSNGLSTSYTFDCDPFAYNDPGYFQIKAVKYTETGTTNTAREVSNTLTPDRKNVAQSVVKDADGTVKEKTEFEYNTDGTVSKTRVYSDIANNVYTETVYTYTYNTDGSYSLTTTVNNVKDADGANAHSVSTTTSFDRFGNVASQTDAKGTKTEYTYDLSGRVLSVQVSNAAGTELSEKTYSYDVDDNTVDITRENGRQEKQIFDSFGNPQKSQVNYDGGFKTVYEYTYDTFGRPVTATEIARYASDGSVEEKYTTTNEYDDRNRVTKQTTKNNAGTVVYEVSAQYGDASGKQYTIQRMTGDDDYAVAGYKSEYDAFGRKTADVILNNTTEYSRTDYTYDCFGNLLTARDDKARAESLPYSVQYEYDQGSRVLSETDVFGNASTNTYDNAGRLISAQEAAGKTISYAYDALGRAILTHDGSNYVRSYYDDNGNLIKEIDASSANATTGHIKTYEYDDLNRLTHSFNSRSATDLSSLNGLKEYYTYDVMGNVLSTAQDGGMFDTVYTYDILGRMTSMTDAEDETETYTYNFDGTLKTKTDRKGTVFTYSNYDVFKNAGKIQAVNGAKTQTLWFTYDMMNNLTRENNSESDHVVSYAYDFLGRLIEQDGYYVVNQYAYDSLGNRTEFTLNRRALSGNLYELSSQTYTYDAKSRLASTTAFDKTSVYEYNEDDQLTQKQMGILKTKRIRDNKNLVTREFVSEPIDDALVKFYHEIDYTYDYKSDLQSESRDDNSFRFDVNYTYDGANRISEIAYHDTYDLESHYRMYGFDARNNISAIYQEYVGREETTSHLVDFDYYLNNHIWGLSWIHENDVQTGFQVFDSDTNGNRIDDAGKTVAFDLFNRMVSFTDENDVETTYTYTASGLRESKTTSDGVQTFFMWDGGNMVLEYVVTDEYQLIADYKKYYAYGADGLAYRKDSDGSVYTYNTNYRGDVLSVMDDDLNKKAEYLFDAYGNIIKSSITPGFTDNFGYRGEYHDPESGYIYLRNRYLDPATGSFTSEDPIRDGLNWFNYCNGNPINYVDSLGLWGADIHWAETKTWVNKWVGTKGFNEYDAGMLAFYDNNTDAIENGTSPFPGIGDQSYHFNTNATGVDSRLQHASENLNNAIWAWNQAKINYQNNLKNLENFIPGSAFYKAEERRIDNLYRADKDYALKFLGEGLHAIQDTEAHGNITRGWWISGHIFMEGVDDINYDWTDGSRTNVKESGNRTRLRATESATYRYVALFFDSIN